MCARASPTVQDGTSIISYTLATSDLCDPLPRFAVPQGGMEYVLELVQVPHLFVIRKQIRKGPDVAAPGALNTLAYYYVLDK